jgi:hypothetical protein
MALIAQHCKRARGRLDCLCPGAFPDSPVTVADSISDNFLRVCRGGVCGTGDRAQGRYKALTRGVQYGRLVEA